MSEQHSHKWVVFSTALATCELMVACECGAFGTVPNPTKREWSDAFHAPSKPYSWNEPKRVKVHDGMTTVMHPVHNVRTVTKG